MNWATDVLSMACPKASRCIDPLRYFYRLPSPLRRHRIVQMATKLFPHSRRRLVPFNSGASAFLDLQDAEARNVFITGSFEPEFFEIATRIMAKGGVLFDGGANFGLCSFGLIPRIDVERTEFHLFEANANLEPFMRESRGVIAPHARMLINIGCLSDHEGQSRFEVDFRETGKSHLSDSGCVTVPNIVLDDYLRRMSLRKVRLLKLDIEGQELAALRGAKEALDTGLIDFVYCEIRSELLARYELVPLEVVEFFWAHKFKVFFCRSRDLVAPVNLRLDNHFILPLEQIGDRIPDGTDILAIHESVSMTPIDRRERANPTQ